MAPGEKGGSRILYDRLIRPLVLKYRPDIEKKLKEGKLNIFIKCYCLIILCSFLAKDTFKKFSSNEDK